MKAPLVIAAILVLATAGCRPGAAEPDRPEPEPVRIAIINPQTGEFSSLGKWEHKGVKLAVDEANAAGGINGRPIELSVFDDEGVAANAAAWKLGPMGGTGEYPRFALTSRGLIDRLDDEAGQPHPCRMSVNASSEAFDPQPIELGFTHLPSRALLATIERELSAVVARARA